MKVTDLEQVKRLLNARNYATSFLRPDAIFNIQINGVYIDDYVASMEVIQSCIKTELLHQIAHYDAQLKDLGVEL